MDRRVHGERAGREDQRIAVGGGVRDRLEPDLARRILGDDEPAHDHGLCVSSNLCVPAQMLGMKGACYNPAVVKLGRTRT